MEQLYLKELFSFQVEHRKRTNPDEKLFQMEPTEEGAKTLNSYGLYFKVQDKGFVIAAPCIQHTDTGLLELKNPFGGNTKLAFAVFTTDKYFFDHSDLPYDPPGEYVYYFNNLNGNERRTKLLLSKCSIKETERVKLHIKQFTGTVVKSTQQETLLPQVFNCRGNLVPKTQYDVEIDEYQNTYLLDLARMVDGLYTVEYNGERLTCYCTKASFIRRIPLFILEIFTDPDVPEKYQIIKQVNGVQYIDNKQFCLYFGINFYYWRYKIIPVKLPSSSWIKIITDQSDYTFNPDKTRIHNCQDYVQFTSEQEIDTPDEELTVNLYQLVWNSQCRLSTELKYLYCSQDFWIAQDGEFWCRELCQNAYNYKCPARYMGELIGQLPKPGGESTLYYTEDEKVIAQLTLYLVHENGNYLIKETYDPPAAGDFTHSVIENVDDVTIQFVNKVSMSYVILHYLVTDKISQQDMTMNKIGNLYQMENIVKRLYPQSKISIADQIVYWFTYELISNKKTYTSEKFTHVFKTACIS